MLQRFYGVSFPKASQLEEHMQKLEDAKQRDHRKIGKQLDLFMTHELVGSGLPMYLPNGATIRRLLEQYILNKEINWDINMYILHHLQMLHYTKQVDTGITIKKICSQ